MTAAATTVRRRRATRPPARGQVVFVHGTLDDGHSFRAAADRIPEWDTITYDRRGWGRSPHEAGSFTADVEDLCGILRDIGPSGLVGHSFGGTVACAAAAATPGLVTWAVAYEPPLPWLPWWPAMAPWEELVLAGAGDPGDAAERLMRGVLGDAGWDRLPAGVQARRRDAGPALVAEMAALRADPPGFDPLTVRPPVLVAAGERSLEHHRAVSARLAELLPGGRYVELAGAGHGAHVEEPVAFADLVNEAAILPTT